MQGQQHFQPNTPINVDLDAFIPVNHLLRKIDRQVDFSFVRPLTASYYCMNNGRPSIDPEVFFRMVLVGYLYGIQSDRRLCEEVYYNLAYRWFCHLSLTDEVPDHSSITRIRDRLGLKVFQQFFQAILQQCQQRGLLKGQRIISDSVLMTANASLNSLVANDPEQAAQEQQTFQRGLETPRRRLTNKTHTSQTDPEATLAQKKGTPRRLKYKAHVSIDADSRVIVDTQVTTGACHESQVYLSQLMKLKQEQALPVQEVIADRAYGSGDILQALQEQQITAYIPLFHRQSGGFVVNEAQGFSFDPIQNRYRCPAGRDLIPYPTMANNTITYHTQGKDCCACPIKAHCAAKIKTHTTLRIVRRHIHQALFEQTAQHMQTPLFRAKLAERLWKIEGLFSEAKAQHCLAKAKYRGLSKMQIQAYLSACAQNIKRIILIILSLGQFIYLNLIPLRSKRNKANSGYTFSLCF